MQPLVSFFFSVRQNLRKDVWQLGDGIDVGFAMTVSNDAGDHGQISIEQNSDKLRSIESVPGSFFIE